MVNNPDHAFTNIIVSIGSIAIGILEFFAGWTLTAEAFEARQNGLINDVFYQEMLVRADATIGAGICELVHSTFEFFFELVIQAEGANSGSSESSDLPADILSFIVAMIMEYVVWSLPSNPDITHPVALAAKDFEDMRGLIQSIFTNMIGPLGQSCFWAGLGAFTTANVIHMIGGLKTAYLLGSSFLTWLFILFIQW